MEIQVYESKILSNTLVWFVCVLNLIQIAIKLKEKEDIHTWNGEDGEKREIWQKP